MGNKGCYVIKIILEAVTHVLFKTRVLMNILEFCAIQMVCFSTLYITMKVFDIPEIKTFCKYYGEKNEFPSFPSMFYTIL